MESITDKFVFTEDLLASCDEIAEDCLGIVLRRRLYPKLKSALYENSTAGNYLLVCVDGSILFTHKEIGIDALVAGFKNGLRSNPQAVKEKNKKLTESFNQ